MADSCCTKLAPAARAEPEPCPCQVDFRMGLSVVLRGICEGGEGGEGGGVIL